MECKSCGSTKFKRIRYDLSECEYCGRRVEDEDQCSTTEEQERIDVVDLYGRIHDTKLEIARLRHEAEQLQMCMKYCK